jgi:hypothetical protein
MTGQEPPNERAGPYAVGAGSQSNQAGGTGNRILRDYTAEALVLARLGGQVVDSDDIGVYAIELAH